MYVDRFPHYHLHDTALTHLEQNAGPINHTALPWVLRLITRRKLIAMLIILAIDTGFILLLFALIDFIVSFT
jgi:hypothetical protein